MRRTTLYLAALLAASACSDGTAPAPLLFRYDLVSVGDETLPATLYGQQRFTTNDGVDVTCEDRLLSRRLELGRSHRYTVTDASLLVCDDGRPDVETHATSGGTYTLAGDVLTLAVDEWYAVESDTELIILAHPANLIVFEKVEPGRFRGKFAGGMGKVVDSASRTTQRSSCFCESVQRIVQNISARSLPRSPHRCRRFATGADGNRFLSKVTYFLSHQSRPDLSLWPSPRPPPKARRR